MAKRISGLLVFLCISYWVNAQAILPSSSIKRLQVVLTAEKYMGIRYRKKIDKMIFDCSGFVKYVLSQVDINVTRSSVTIVHDGKKVTPRTQARPGDIIVFKGRNHRNKRPGHVGLVHHVAGDTIHFIHSSTTRGVVMGHTYETYYAKRFLQVRDVIGD
ncbi:MAG: C40 family peptidase [Saprospiraceae bacterium]|jgi:cell wall-associated NlpC family hydrolase|nr:C40 family peptidase [Saprospiraceae bacterium]